jgi:hypothetical protein
MCRDRLKNQKAPTDIGAFFIPYSHLSNQV